MTNDMLAVRRSLSAAIRPRVVECAEPDTVLAATTADALRTLQDTVARLESRVRALENPA